MSVKNHLPISLIGLGSVHGDDQFGWQMVKRLQGSAYFRATYAEHVKVALCRTPLDGFLDIASASRALIVLDAVVSGAPAGTVVRLEEAQLPSVQASAYSSHGYSLVQSIALGRALDLLPQYVVIFGVELAACAAYSPVSVELEQALVQCEQQVVEEIESLLSMD